MRLAQASSLFVLVAGCAADASEAPVALKSEVLSLLQDADQKLASAIVASRAAIRGLLADPKQPKTTTPAPARTATGTSYT